MYPLLSLRAIPGLLFACISAGLACLSPQQAIAAASWRDTVDLGDIPQRPPAPEFGFDRFFNTRSLAQVEFAADHRSLYVLRNDGKVDNVYALDLGTGALRQLTHFSEPVSEFAVGHQGTFLIIVMDVAGNENYDLYRYDLATGTSARLTDAGRGDTTMFCGLSPDDRFVYFAQTRDHRSQAGIWQVDTRSGATRERLSAQGRTLECDGVSSDGRYLAYGDLQGFNERRLGILDLNSGAARLISTTPGVNNINAQFAGDVLYYRSAQDADGFRLWAYRIGDPAPQPVTLPFDNDIQGFDLYADGRGMVVSYRTALAGRVAIFSDGVEVSDRLGLPAEDIVGAVFSDDDPRQGVVFTENAAQPRRYYLIGGTAPQLIYDANQSGIDSLYFAETRSLLVRSFDGLAMPVHLFIPNGTSSRNPRPAIVLVHGGPDDHIDPLYIDLIQYLTNRGFVVAAPNVRGSTGFGKRYALLDNGDWGGAHVHDLVMVAGFLRAQHFIKPDQLFIAGHSFGGFSMMSLVTQYPQVFRAGVDFFGFTELASFVASWPTYLQRGVLEELGFDPRTDRLRNWLTSPIYHVDRISIPLQIHQGANDSRVPREQSDWLVQRLRERGRSVEYYVYPDEGHGFTRFENERTAYKRMVDFLRRQ